MRFQISPIVELGGPGNFGLSPDGRHLAFVGARLRWDRAALDPRPWTRWKSALFPVQRPSARPRLLLSGLPTDASSCSTPAASSRSWMCRAVCRKPCAICRRQCRRGRLVEPRRRHHRREPRRRSVARPRDRRRRSLPSRRSIHRGRRNSICFQPFFPTDAISCTCVSRRARRRCSGTYVGTLDARPEAQSAAAADAVRGRSHLRGGRRFRPGTVVVPSGRDAHGAAVRCAAACARRGTRSRWPSAWAPFATAASSRVSANDVLVYRTADTDSQLTWFDRQGTMIRPRLGTGRLSRRGAFPGWRSGGRVAHESAGRDEGRPVAVRSVAWKRGRHD